jgi:LacI family transcriptional regulator
MKNKENIIQSNVLGFAAVEREITRRIQTEIYKVGQRLPAEREFQKEFGLSRPTISKALSQVEAKGLVERSRGRGTFVKAKSALVPGNSGEHRAKTAIRVVMPGNGGERLTVDHGVFEGLHDIVAPLGVDTVVDFFKSPDDLLEILRRFRNEPDGGLAIWPAANLEVELALGQIAADGIPLVLIDRYLKSFACDYVVNDNVEGAAAMVRHLIGLGHQRILYVSLATYSSSLGYRLGGVVKEMALAGLHLDDNNIVILPPERYDSMDKQRVERKSTIRTLLKKALKEANPPTAIFASNDMLAIEIISVLTEMNIEVPQKISVAGFDNIDAAQYCAVPLTTVAQDFHRMGVLAGKVLLHRMDVANNPYPKVSDGFIHERIEPQMIIRNSTEKITVKH